MVVIGASAGGVNALKTISSGLPAGFPAPILVVVHIGHHPSVLPQLLARAGRLPAQHAQDDETMVDGTIYVAPPDRHLLVDRHKTRITRGPKEHHARPAVDPLFVSAALTHGPGVIGVVLTGNDGDGTSGLQAIKACGGLSVVQHPDSAEYPSMPLNALRHAQIDHIAQLEDIAPLIARLAEGPSRPALAAPPVGLVHEFDLSLAKGAAMEHLNAIAKPSTFVCPECQGALWEIHGSQPKRYRCHVGHAYNDESLLQAETEATDSSLWAAIRALQERGLLLDHMAARHDDPERQRAFKAAAREMHQQSDRLRGMVENGPDLLSD
jgi:two-component system chemotaxis response regulator CheB